MNYYDELEVSIKASTEVIKAAYKAQAKKYHPDLYRGDPRFATEKLVNLNRAYEILTNSQKREEYDYLNNFNINKKPSSNTSTNTSNNTYSYKTNNNTSNNYNYKTNNNTKKSNKHHSNIRDTKKDEEINDWINNLFIIIPIIILIIFISILK